MLCILQGWFSTGSVELEIPLSLNPGPNMSNYCIICKFCFLWSIHTSKAGCAKIKGLSNLGCCSGGVQGVVHRTVEEGTQLI